MNQTTHARQGEGMLDWMEGAPTLIDEEVRSSKSVCVYLQGKTNEVSRWARVISYRDDLLGFSIRLEP
jgi:hypothetical protein